MKISTLLLILITISGCARQISSNSALLPKAQVKLLLQQCSRPTPENVDGFWSVSPQVAQNVDRDIEKVSLQSPNGVAINRPRAYLRQYGGIVISGKHFVYINAIRDDAFGQIEIPWKTKEIRICNGGETSWGALYDPATVIFSKLTINGSI